LDRILPDPATLKYIADRKWLGVIGMKARERFRDKTMNLAGGQAKGGSRTTGRCPAMVRLIALFRD